MEVHAALTDPAKAVAIVRLGGGHIYSNNYEYFQLLNLGANNFLRGFRKDRFAGTSTAYGSIELRARLFQSNSYILPGEVGILGFDDVGRVWRKGEHSNKWHNCYGAGFYYAAYNYVLLSGIYVKDLFNKLYNSKLVFHDLQHTENVVKRTEEIAAHYKLSNKEMLTLYVAAWFHDTGHLYTEGFHKHEEESVHIMKRFMHEYDDADKELIPGIEACIMATKMPRNPVNLLQEIICDADVYHLGTKDFKETNRKVFEEYNLRVEQISKHDWDIKSLEILKDIHFYTSYCKDLLDEKKKANMKKLKKKVKADGSKEGDLTFNKANSLTTKGIQTMLRLTSENHLKLSDMADHKANILISVNSIIISVILGVLLRKLEEEPVLTIPTIFFLLVAVTTIVLAILATRPKVSGGTFTEQDVLDKKTNLLFFGNFYKAPFEHYDTAMRTLMKDPDYLYGALIKDIYMLSVVLGRKYKLIRIAYYIFMVGLVVSVAAFAVAVLFFNKTQALSGATSAFPL